MKPTAFSFIAFRNSIKPYLLFKIPPYPSCTNKKIKKVDIVVDEGHKLVKATSILTQNEIKRNSLLNFITPPRIAKTHAS